MNTMPTQKLRKVPSRILTLLLCILMVLSFAISASAAGSRWAEAKIRTGYGTVTTSAYVLDTPAKNCTSFDLAVEIDMKNNTKCTDWDIWIRSGGSFTKVSSLSLPDGTGSASKTVKLSPAKNFDAVAITPTKRGSYSWALGMAVTNVSDGSGTATQPTTAPKSASESDSDEDIVLLEGDYEKVNIRTCSNNYTVHAFVLDTPLRGVRSIGVAINVSMKYNTHCYDWDVWVRSGGSFKKVGSLYLEDGDGFATDTISFKYATNFDAVAVIPTKPGGYSWTMGVGVYNPQ